MKNILKRGLIIVGIYSIFTVYLFLACNRIERLEEDTEEKVNVTIIYSE